MYENKETKVFSLDGTLNESFCVCVLWSIDNWPYKRSSEDVIFLIGDVVLLI